MEKMRLAAARCAVFPMFVFPEPPRVKKVGLKWLQEVCITADDAAIRRQVFEGHDSAPQFRGGMWINPIKPDHS